MHVFFQFSKGSLIKNDNIFFKAHVEEIAGIVSCTFKTT